MSARFLKDRRGGTAIEYAMIAAFVAIMIITALTSMGTSLKGNFNDVLAGFSGVAP